MSQQYPSSWKNCATCAYWVGTRETDYFGNYAKVESYSTKGKCMCHKGPWRNIEKTANMSCNAFEKWAVLK